MERSAPLWEEKIMWELRNGRNVMVVGHANTLRGLVKTIDGISDDEIQDVAIPTGIPIVYKFDKNMNSVEPTMDQQTAAQIHMNGLFLEKPGLLKEALAREEEWSRQIPGYTPTMSNRKVMTPLERSLYKLRAERELGKWAGQFIDPNAPLEDDGNDGNMGTYRVTLNSPARFCLLFPFHSPWLVHLSPIGKPMQLIEDEVWELGMHELEEGAQFDPDAPVFHPSNGEPIAVNGDDVDDDSLPVGEASTVAKNHPCVTSFPSASVIPGFGSARTSDLNPAVETCWSPSLTFLLTCYTAIRRDPVIVIIRHGKTEHNKLGLFTGWEDAPLAEDGVDEAREAGRLLKAHGFEFDVVYTSWLSRAIETAWHVIDELDALWLPIVKTWRLNERM